MGTFTGLKKRASTSSSSSQEILGTQRRFQQVTVDRQLFSSEDQQTSDICAEEENTTMPGSVLAKGGLSTIHKNAAAIFETLGPIVKEVLKHESCELPRSRQGTKKKTIEKKQR